MRIKAEKATVPGSQPVKESSVSGALTAWLHFSFFPLDSSAVFPIELQAQGAAEYSPFVPCNSRLLPIAQSNFTL